ncbi:MAG TPA: histidine phosphatase family protein [Aquifex aeolicus]|uniref:Histidine phosphatase family protein n=1 Tax=Aquifex aeolicus TaxID=63363 RepID=A0A7C5L2U3_AQUAO|nr:histidine phosphatase family protein [Aquifex aeolicus]
MLKLIIARHAESEWNPIGRYQGLLDPPLTERGRAQAELLARELAKDPPHVIYTSPLRRTLQTAEIIAEHLGAPLKEEERIVEIDHGRWSGLLVEEVREKYPEEFEIWLRRPERASFEGGESLRNVYERVASFLRDIEEEHRGQTVLLVSHTVPIRCMLCYLLGLELSRFWSFGCDNASYSVVLVEEERNVLQRLNVTCHLGDLYVEAHKAL